MVTATLALVMSVFLVGLARPHRYLPSCAVLAVFFALIALSAALLAIHLVYDVPGLIEIRALLALLAVPCLYLYFAFATPQSPVLAASRLIHLLPFAGGVALLAARMPWLLDLVLLATYLLYGGALLHLWRTREYRFAGLKDSARPTLYWLVIAILFLGVSLVLDLWIFIDLAAGGFLQQSTALIFSVLSLVALVAFSLLGALGRPSLFEHLYSLAAETGFVAPQGAGRNADGTDQALAAQAMRRLEDPALLGDGGLTLLRLARKLGVPARRLSQAINRVHGCSFSDFLNDRRIAYCEQLMRAPGDKSLMDIMLDAGYSSRSNFYRQFSQRTGMTPAAYRARHAPPGASS